MVKWSLIYDPVAVGVAPHINRPWIFMCLRPVPPLFPCSSIHWTTVFCIMVGGGKTILSLHPFCGRRWSFMRGSLREINFYSCPPSVWLARLGGSTTLNLSPIFWFPHIFILNIVDTWSNQKKVGPWPNLSLGTFRKVFINIKPCFFWMRRL